MCIMVCHNLIDPIAAKNWKIPEKRKHSIAGRNIKDFDLNPYKVIAIRPQFRHIGIRSR